MDSKSIRNKQKRPTKSRALVVGICGFLIALTWAVFGQTLRNDFVNYDDDIYVYRNPHVVHGITLRGIAWAFTSRYAANWHPLTWISHMLDVQLWGLNPAGHHFTNVLLHSISVVLLFLVFRSATGMVWRSSFVAVLFAIHPLHVESVAWIAERKDILSGLFFVLTLGAYVGYVRRRAVWRYILVFLSLALGLMCKPILVTTPFILLLFDYWPLRRFATEKKEGRWPMWRMLLLEKVPMLGLSAASCAATIWAQTATIASTEKLPFLVRAQNAVASYLNYMWQMIRPVKLAVFYPHPERGLPLSEVVVAAVLLSLITAFAVVLRRKYPYLIAGWLWYVGMLVPVIGLVQVGMQARADRYTYLSQIGLYFAGTWLVAGLLSSWQHRVRLLGPAAATVILLLAWLASNQAAVWRNSETLWTHALAVTPNNAVARFNFGNLFLDRNDLDQAIEEYRLALRDRAGFGEAENNLGLALERKGRSTEAMTHFEKAIQDIPNHAQAFYNLGNIYFHQGRLEEAIASYKRALSNSREYPEASYNLGIALAEKGDWRGAIASYRQALKDNPDYAEAFYALGNSFLAMRQFDKAIARYNQALKIRPRDAAVQNNLAVAFLQKGNIADAVSHWEKALQIDPDSLDALNNLAWLLATFPEASVRDGVKAVRLAERACRLSQNKSPVYLRTLAAAYSEVGRFEEAKAIARQGSELAQAEGDGELVRALDADIARYDGNEAVRMAPSQSP
jgi:protein O-mannosyl-transferase